MNLDTTQEHYSLVSFNGPRVTFLFIRFLHYNFLLAYPGGVSS